MAEFDLTIDQLVELFLPTGFSVSANFQARTIKTWQLILWEGFDGITEDTRFTLDEYPEKAKVLFAALVVHDALQIALSANFLNVMGSAGATEGAESDGGIKSIKTGPTEVEFHDGVSALAKLIAASKSGGGLLLELQEKACTIASQIGISLPFCKALKVQVKMTKGGITVPDVARAILRKP